MTPPARPWWDGRLCAFDVETSGVCVETDRIVTAAVAMCGGGEPTTTRTWLLNPGVEISVEATAVHGVTNERAQAEGMDPAEAIAEIVALLASRPAGSPIVAMNCRFDLTILDREARRHGVEPLAGALVVDPLVVDKHLDRFRRGSRKLDALCAHYRAGLDEAHDAASDALAAARVAWVIGSRGQVVRRVRNADEGRELARLKREWETVRHDLRALHAAQVGWAREQAVGLADYFRGKGQLEDADSVQTAWPLVPFVEARAA